MSGVINFRTAWAEVSLKLISPPNLQAICRLVIRRRNGGGLPYESNTYVIPRNNFGKLGVVLGAAYYHSDSYNYGNFEHQGRIFANLRYKINNNLIVQVNTLANKGSLIFCVLAGR